MSLLVKLDRLIIGLILRSKLVFLINVPAGRTVHPNARSVTAAERMGIDNESDQVP